MAVQCRKILLSAVGLLVAVLYSRNAFAEHVMVEAATKTVMTFNSVKGILFIVGGFGLVGLTCAAIFGRMSWKWFAGLGLGLAIVAAAGSIVYYASGDYMDSLSQETVNDTFADGMNGSSGGYSGGSGFAGNVTGGTKLGGGSSGGNNKGGKTGFWNGVAAGITGNSSDNSGNSAWYNTGVTVGSAAGGALSGFLGGSKGNDFSASDLRINN